VSTCCVCGAAGRFGVEFSDAAWCDEHASWLAEEVREFPDCLTPDGPDEDGVQSWYLDEAAHDAIVEGFREAHAEKGPVFVADPLDGLSLYGVGGAA
jgi:hypothetical protein